MHTKIVNILEVITKDFVKNFKISWNPVIFIKLSSEFKINMFILCRCLCILHSRGFCRKNDLENIYFCKLNLGVILFQLFFCFYAEFLSFYNHFDYIALKATNQRYCAQYCVF